MQITSACTTSTSDSRISNSLRAGMLTLSLCSGVLTSLAARCPFRGTLTDIESHSVSCRKDAELERLSAKIAKLTEENDQLNKKLQVLGHGPDSGDVGVVSPRSLAPSPDPRSPGSRQRKPEDDLEQVRSSKLKVTRQLDSSCAPGSPSTPTAGGLSQCSGRGRTYVRLVMRIVSSSAGQRSRPLRHAQKSGGGGVGSSLAAESSAIERRRPTCCLARHFPSAPLSDELQQLFFVDKVK